MRQWIGVWWLAMLGAFALAVPHAQDHLAARLDRAVRAAGVPIVGVSIGDPANRATWTVQPSSLQVSAQPTIDAFNPLDPAYETEELDAEVRAALDNERLTASVVWVILKQMYPADTDAQTKTKFGVARTRIINAYLTTPWK